MGDTEILLDADEVARRIGCTRRHVERLNSEGQGPPSVRIGRRLRRYPERLFEEWIKSLHGARMAGGRKNREGLKDALARNIERYTNIYTVGDGRVASEIAAMDKFKSEVTVTIDEGNDLGYIYLKSPWSASAKQLHVKGDCEIILDFDAEGHIIGIETLRASEHIHPIMRASAKTLSEVVAELRAITGSGWKDIDDPLAELRRLRGGDEISGIDAHFLLFAVDAYVATDSEGRVTEARDGLSLEGWQRIRDCLFEVHEHRETSTGDEA